MSIYFYPSLVRITAKHLAASCAADTECVFADSKCPFGCYIAVNQTRKQFIDSLIQNYPSSCVYKCPQAPQNRCIDGRCRIVYSYSN